MAGQIVVRFALASCMMVALVLQVRGFGSPVAHGVFPKWDGTLGLCGSMVEIYGYPCREFTVQTEDGFLLGLQNIPHGLSGSSQSKAAKSGPRQPVVFLQHGLFGGGDNFLFNGPQESLGFILADAGYDVWIGNIRGVSWSKGHISLQPSQAAFWDWSWDELAAYDLPAMLEFVYNHTDGSKISYIGHSQGTSILVAALTNTLRSAELTNMLAGATLLCPIVHLEHTTSVVVRTAADVYLDKVVGLFGPSEFTIHNAVGVKLLDNLCTLPHIDCSNLVTGFTGHNCCVNQSRLEYYLQFGPQPSSTKNLAHFAQMVRNGVLTMFDYGSIGNMAHYNQNRPPSYDVTKLSTSLPLFLVTGSLDALADTNDVQILQSQLGNHVIQALNVPTYAHADFVLSPTANADVYQYILTFMQHNNMPNSSKPKS